MASHSPSNGVLYGPDGKPLRWEGGDGQMFKHDGFALPHVLTFSAILSSGWKTYWHEKWDEARRHSVEDANAMWNDTWIQSLLQERFLAVVSLPWRIEVPNEKDPVQKQTQAILTELIESIRGLHKLQFTLLKALWFGRYGIQAKWIWSVCQGQKCLNLAQWLPVNGDKIGHSQDHTPYISMHAAEANRVPGAQTVYTTYGARGLLLKGSWRERFLIHYHEPDDADFFDAEAAEAVHGVGIRSRIFWLDWLKREWLSNLTDFIERAGLGVELWYYDASNPNSKTEVQEAAEETTGTRTRILVPRFGNERQPTVEVVNVPMTGAELLLKLQDRVDKIQERYIVGQHMSSGDDQSNSLGGTGRANFAMDTKQNIRDYDARNLDDTLTGDDVRPGLVSMLQKWSLPQTYPSRDNPDGFRARFAHSLEDQQSQDKLNSASILVQQGLPVRADDMYSAAGLTKPDEGDDVVDLQALQAMSGGLMPGQDSPSPQDGDSVPEDDQGNPQFGIDESGQMAEPMQDRPIVPDEEEDAWQRHTSEDGQKGMRHRGTGEFAQGDHHDLDEEDLRALGFDDEDIAEIMGSESSEPESVNYEETTMPQGQTSSSTPDSSPATPSASTSSTPPKPLTQLRTPAKTTQLMPSTKDVPKEGWAETHEHLAQHPQDKPWQPVQTRKGNLAHRNPYTGHVIYKSAPPSENAYEHAHAQITKQTANPQVRTSDSLHKESLQALLPHNPTAEEFARLVGMPPGSQAELSGDSYFQSSPFGASLSGSSHQVNSMDRGLSANAQGELEISNDGFFVKRNHQRKGIGGKAFSSQVENASQLGVARITTVGGKGGGMRGWQVWPAMGYDAPLDDDIRWQLQHSKLPESIKHSQTVLDLYQTPQGRKWWLRNGDQMEYTFDLHPESRSMQRLQAYRQRKGLPPLQLPTGEEFEQKKAETQQRLQAHIAKHSPGLQAQAHKQGVEDLGDYRDKYGEPALQSLASVYSQAMQRRNPSQHAHQSLVSAYRLVKSQLGQSQDWENLARHEGLDVAKLHDYAAHELSGTQTWQVHPSRAKNAYQEAVWQTRTDQKNENPAEYVADSAKGLSLPIWSRYASDSPQKAKKTNYDEFVSTASRHFWQDIDEQQLRAMSAHDVVDHLRLSMTSAWNELTSREPGDHIGDPDEHGHIGHSDVEDWIGHPAHPRSTHPGRQNYQRVDYEDDSTINEPSTSPAPSTPVSSPSANTSAPATPGAPSAPPVPNPISPTKPKTPTKTFLERWHDSVDMAQHIHKNSEHPSVHADKIDHPKERNLPGFHKDHHDAVSHFDPNKHHWNDWHPYTIGGQSAWVNPHSAEVSPGKEHPVTHAAQHAKPKTHLLAHPTAESKKQSVHDLGKVMELHTDDDWGKLVGQQPGATTHVNADSYSQDSIVDFDTEHNKYAIQHRVLKFDNNGQLVLRNKHFKLGDDHNSGGHGVRVFSDQVLNATNHGVHHIETQAAGDATSAERGGYVGYKVWPKMGFDGDIPRHLALPRGLRRRSDGTPVKTIQDLRELPGGKEFWEQHGESFEGTFDLEPGSRSWRVLNEYRQSKGLPEFVPDESKRERIQENLRTLWQKHTELHEPTHTDQREQFYRLLAIGGIAQRAQDAMHSLTQNLQPETQQFLEQNPGVIPAALRRINEQARYNVEQDNPVDFDDLARRQLRAMASRLAGNEHLSFEPEPRSQAIPVAEFATDQSDEGALTALLPTQIDPEQRDAIRLRRQAMGRARHNYLEEHSGVEPYGDEVHSLARQRLQQHMQSVQENNPNYAFDANEMATAARNAYEDAHEEMQRRFENPDDEPSGISPMPADTGHPSQAPGRSEAQRLPDGGLDDAKQDFLQKLNVAHPKFGLSEYPVLENVSLAQSLAKSGIPKAALSGSRGQVSINDFLYNTQLQEQLQGAYALGLSTDGSSGVEQILQDMTRAYELTPWQEAYRDAIKHYVGGQGQLVPLNDPQKATGMLMEFLAQQDKPVVMFAPNNATEMGEWTKAEIEWLRDNPDKRSNFQFVFGLYDLIQPAQAKQYIFTGQEHPLDEIDKVQEILKNPFVHENVPESDSYDSRLQAIGLNPDEPPLPVPQEKHAEHSEAILDLAQQSLDESDLPDEEKTKHIKSLQELLANMTPTVVARMRNNLQSVSFHKDAASVSEAAWLETAEYFESQGNTKAAQHYRREWEMRQATGNYAVGAVVHDTRKLYLDGPKLTEDFFDKQPYRTKANSISDIQAHEIGHVIDMLFGLSKSESWFKSWSKDIAKGLEELAVHTSSVNRERQDVAKLTRYAETNPQEGFAEFMRLLYTSGLSPEEIEKRFPHPSAFVQYWSLWPGGSEFGESQTRPLQQEADNAGEASGISQLPADHPLVKQYAPGDLIVEPLERGEVIGEKQAMPEITQNWAQSRAWIAKRPAVKKGIYAYTGEDYIDINGFLRNPDIVLSDKQSKAMARVSRALQATTPMDEPINVYRGLYLSKEQSQDVLKAVEKVHGSGDYLQMKGFQSASLSPTIAFDAFGSSNTPVGFAIRASRGIYVDDFFHTGEGKPGLRKAITANDGEMEFLQDHDSVYRVLGISKEKYQDKYGNTEDIHLVQLEQIPSVHENPDNIEFIHRFDAYMKQVGIKAEPVKDA